MNVTTLGVIGFLIGLLAAVLGALMLVGTRKRKPKYVQVPGKPGTVIELVADDGHVFGLVVLARITHDSHGGTTALFEDYTRFMRDRRVPTSAEWFGQERRRDNE